jgi:hypothetical protein
MIAEGVEIKSSFGKLLQQVDLTIVARQLKTAALPARLIVGLSLIRAIDALFRVSISTTAGIGADDEISVSRATLGRLSSRLHSILLP